MPWVNEDMCVGCGICEAECPVDAISVVKGVSAEIDEAVCIRCGKCHDVCPKEAVRHDSEKIPLLIEENLSDVQQKLNHFQTLQDKSDFFERIKRFYRMKAKVANMTIERIEQMQDEQT
ncbi:DUF362 domain-containing protein [Sedimentisphaera salicampi]|uniref:Ferredoxin n=1 Tax=Sedimentisphaera salicampi TaxID=1941349 RepID=A0A1W6LP54_9BACT|nr:4Fe-4S binding protein [Sedimentisphaera salicampi]ARN57568.1 Ferredoxin [Sedimentisphaera salicampi]